jgi:surface protein
MSNARYGLRTKTQGSVSSLSQTTFEFDKSAFVLLVDTGIRGDTADNQFKLNFSTAGSDTYDVRTSDGQILTGQTNDITLTFPSMGEYLIQIKGNLDIVNYWPFGTASPQAATADRNKILQVVNWGTYTFGRIIFGGNSNFGILNGFLNMRISAKDRPIFKLGSGRTNFQNTFSARIPIAKAIETWNVTGITNMSAFFSENAAFNKNIGSWDVSSVTTMSDMFANALSFNNGGSGDINNWVTSSVTAMNSMFGSATLFNQDISAWNVSSVDTFQFMFQGATSFNQNLGAWQLRTAGTNLQNIFNNTAMNTANYTDTIVGWANYVFSNSGTPANVNMTGQSGRTFTNSRSGGANFVDAQAARAYLVSVGWTISGDTVV